MTFVVSLLLSALAIKAYFSLAKKYDIVDRPNNRSSHSEPTYRGGGVVFLLGVTVYYISAFEYHYFYWGLLVISLVSLLDDIVSLSALPRFFVHGITVSMLLFDMGAFSVSWPYLFLVFIFSVGVINAYNFMDGINGMTAVYNVVVLLNCYFATIILGVESQLLSPLMASLLVFSFFNVRARARCFAGDVGAVSMAYCIIFIVGVLLQHSFRFEPLLFFAVYGIDCSLTIIQRLWGRENVFKPHRKHLYQNLVHGVGMRHLSVTGIYSVIQLVVGGGALLNMRNDYFDDSLFVVVVFGGLVAVYLFVKIKVTKKSRHAL